MRLYSEVTRDLQARSQMVVQVPVPSFGGQLCTLLLSEPPVHFSLLISADIRIPGSNLLWTYSGAGLIGPSKGQTRLLWQAIP